MIQRTDDLTNLRLLTRLPLDKEYLWTLVLFAPNSTQPYNFAHHFGCLPSTNNISPAYKHCKLSPGIFAPVILQESSIPPRNLKCDETSPMVTVGSGSYAYFHLTEAVFMRSAFWALPLFSNAAMKYRTEWTYIIQWLLWHTGQGLTVHLPSSYQQYANTLSSPSEMINLLSQTECSTAVDDCIISLLRRLLSLQLISNQFTKIMTNWLQDLMTAGYIFPTIKRYMGMNCSIPVTWSPVLPSAESENRFVAVSNVANSAELQNHLCGTENMERTEFGVTINLTHPWHQFRHLLLVVTFNLPHYEVIPYLELLYRSIFPHIIYCGPKPLDIASIPALGGYRISFITYKQWPVHRAPGSVNYQCAVRAIRLNFAVDGFLFASDDLLLLPVPLSRLNRDQVWFVPANEIRIGDLETLRECHLGMCDFYPHWDWWADYKTATIEAMDRMTQLARSSSLLYHCLSTLRQRNGVGYSQIRVNGAYSDIFYIPSRIAHNFADVSEIFSDFGVFLEIAVPTVLQCIEPIENYQQLPGKDIQVCLFCGCIKAKKVTRAVIFNSLFVN